MAVVKFSGLITDMKGKIGGTSFQGGTAGTIIKSINYKRNGSKLTKADAGRVVNQKALIANLSSTWRTLSNAERDSWNTGAVNYPFKNKYGENYTGSGFQVFMHLNAGLELIGVGAHNTCPTPQTVDTSNVTSVTKDGTADMTLTLAAAVPGTSYLQVWATGLKAPGTSPHKSEYKLINNYDSEAGATINIQDDWEDVYGTQGTGGNVFFQFRYINQATGQKSTWTYAICVVA